MRANGATEFVNLGSRGGFKGAGGSLLVLLSEPPLPRAKPLCLRTKTGMWGLASLLEEFDLSFDTSHRIDSKVVLSRKLITCL